MGIIKRVLDKVVAVCEKYPQNKHLGKQEYKLCKYTLGANSECPIPGCVVGQGIKDEIPDLYELLAIEEPKCPADFNSTWGEYTNRGANSTLIEHCQRNGIVYDAEDYGAMRMLNDIQAYQDQGKLWGEALTQAMVDNG